MHRLFKRLLLFFTLFLMVTAAVRPQTVSIGTPFVPTNATDHFSILGSDEQYVYIMCVSEKNVPKLLTYKHDLVLVSTSDQPILDNSFLLSFVHKKEGIEFFCETFIDGNRVYTLHSQIADKITEKVILTLPPEAGGKWDFIASPENNFYILYSIAGILQDSVKLNLIVLNKDYEVLDGKQFSFFLDRQFDKLGGLNIDDEGNIYTMIYDRPMNYRLGSHLRLFKYTPAGESFTRKEYYFKEKKPSDIRLSFSSKNKQAFLHSLYYDFYVKDINGILCGIIDDKLEPVAPFSYYVFDKNFKKQLNTFNSGVSSADLMNYLRINNASVNDSGGSFVSVTLETDKIQNIAPNNFSNIEAGKTVSIMDDDPLLGILQRETLIRRQMGYRGPVRGRRFSSSPGSNMDYAEAYSNVMNQRPDLFFMPMDSSSDNKAANGFLKKKIYDRQLVFSFNKNAELKWQRWYETEDQSLVKKNPLYAVETDSSFVSVYYRHNIKEKAELAFTKISKTGGTVQDIVLNIPAGITLLTTSPAYKLGNNKIAILYFDNTLNKVGLAKVEW